MVKNHCRTVTPERRGSWPFICLSLVESCSWGVTTIELPTCLVPRPRMSLFPEDAHRQKVTGVCRKHLTAGRVNVEAMWTEH